MQVSAIGAVEVDNAHSILTATDGRVSDDGRSELQSNVSVVLGLGIHKEASGLLLDGIALDLLGSCGNDGLGGIEFLLQSVVGSNQSGVLSVSEILDEHLVYFSHNVVQGNYILACASHSHRTNLELSSVEVCALFAEGVVVLIITSSLSESEAEVGVRAVEVDRSRINLLACVDEGQIDVANLIPVLTIVAGGYVHVEYITIGCTLTAGHIHFDNA